MTDEIKIHCAHDRLVDVTELVPHPRNPNKHGDAQVALLAKIIRHTGWRSPIVVSKRSGFIVAGHGRLEAGKLLGCQSVPVNFQEFATEADEIFNLAANCLGERKPFPSLPTVHPKRVRATIVECSVCMMPFYRHAHVSQRTECSKLCAYHKRRKYPVETRNCKQCGGKFLFSAKPFSNNAGKFCSMPCRNKFYETLVGPLSHSWKGQTVDDRRERVTKGYFKWRAAVFKRDKRTCQKCFAVGVKIVAHHLKPFATHKELRLVVDNGQTLCEPCHFASHGGNFREDLKHGK